MKSDKRTTSTARRWFLQTTGLAAGAALGGLAVPRTAIAAAAPLPKKWDITTDVLIVGTGFAGLAAAIEARDAKADVMVIEKMPVPGGNSTINGGDFGAAGTPMQKAAGIEDSPELMFKDMMRAGGYLNHPELARTVAEQSAAALEWSQNYVGAQFDRVNFHGGHSVKRAHQTVQRSGSGLVTKELEKARALGAKIELRTKLTRLVADKDGRIVGGEVRRGYRFPDEASGTVAFIKTKGRVLFGRPPTT
jgi:succinate dehydrogenase/fumarate reductase flavoprotein subunit